MDKDYLVGCTGFVGSNIMTQHRFTGTYHASDIAEAYGGKPDLLVYAGVPAEMFLANQNPQGDMERIKQAINNIERIAPRKIVLISTVAVYPTPKEVDEDTCISADELSAYGANRYMLECWVKENCEEHLIVRLPALFGHGLKKNFLYDYIHIIPALLKAEKYLELIAREPILSQYYNQQDNGYFRCRELSGQEKILLKACFQRLRFSALCFTDSRSKYQFYALKRLWSHIERALQYKLSLVNIAVPPLEVGELYRDITGHTFKNYLEKPPYDYDMKSKYSALFSGNNGYLMTKETEIADIKEFLQTQGAAVQ